MLRFFPPPSWPPAPPGWVPGPGWRPHPAWPPVAPGTVLVRRDERTGWLWRAAPPPEPQRVALERDQKPPGLELWVVLGVFPVSAVLTAVIVLLRHSLGLSVGTGHAQQTLGNRPAANALIDTVETLTEFVPAVLAAYLLTRSGGGLRAIGLDRFRPAADLAPTAKLFVAAYVLPIVVVAPLLSLIHRGDINPSDPTPPQAIYLIPLVLTSVAAGVVEEIVVLGFFTHRLEQRGWGGLPLVAVLVALRLSYHLYYGIGVLTLLPWAVLSVFFYRRRRRLLPFIVAHVLWDTMSFSESYLSGAGFALLLLGIAILLLVLFLVGRQQLQVPVLVLDVDGVARPPSHGSGLPQEWLAAGGASVRLNSTPSG